MVVNGDPGSTVGKLSLTVAVMISFPISKGSFWIDLFVRAVSMDIGTITFLVQSTLQHEDAHGYTYPFSTRPHIFLKGLVSLVVQLQPSHDI